MKMERPISSAMVIELQVQTGRGLPECRERLEEERRLRALHLLFSTVSEMQDRITVLEELLKNKRSKDEISK